ncbi:MAG: hypothetical protein PVF83_07505 [Anaerolineales bacterium]|jgi:hypothetical protein
MADKNGSQDKWVGVTVWLGLFAGLVFTSNALKDVFSGVISTIYQMVGGDVSALFTNFSALFLAILSLVLIFLIFNAWRNLVSLTFELVLTFSGQVEGLLFLNLVDFAQGKEGDETDIPKSSLPSAVMRDLAFSWGLFFITYFVLPFMLPA